MLLVPCISALGSLPFTQLKWQEKDLSCWFGIAAIPRRSFRQKKCRFSEKSPFDAPSNFLAIYGVLCFSTSFLGMGFIYHLVLFFSSLAPLDPFVVAPFAPIFGTLLWSRCAHPLSPALPCCHCFSFRQATKSNLKTHDKAAVGSQVFHAATFLWQCPGFPLARCLTS